MNIYSSSQSQLLWRRFCAYQPAMYSAGLLLILTIFVLSAPLIELAMGHDANKVDLFNRYLSPSIINPLGTDELGRDLFIRLLYGGRTSLIVGVVAGLFATFLGISIGLSAGYFGGYCDAFLMRLTDSVISLPLLPLLIVLAAIDLTKLGFPETIAQSQGSSFYRIVIIVGLFSWTTVARLVRAGTLSLKEQSFIEAAEAQGAGSFRIMFVHILPNLASPVIVATTLAVGNIILLESVLSFLGLGIQPPMPSWGNLLSNAQALIWESPAAAFYPGLLIFFTVVSLNFLGDGLQYALNTRSRIQPYGR